MPGQGNAGTSPARDPHSIPGLGQPAPGLLPMYPHHHRKGCRERKGTAPPRALAGPPSHSSPAMPPATGEEHRKRRERTKGLPEAGRGQSPPSQRRRAARFLPAHPRHQGGDLAAKSPARGAQCRGSQASPHPLFQGTGLQPPRAASPPQPHAAEGPNPDPASPCPFLAAGRAAPGSRQSLGALPVASPGRRGRWRTAPSKKLGTPGPCEGPERGWGRETGQASLRLQ